VNTLFVIVMIVGTALAILALGAFAVVRIRALAFYGVGMSSMLLVAPAAVMECGRVDVPVPRRAVRRRGRPVPG
jgi:hypothetical protein